MNSEQEKIIERLPIDCTVDESFEYSFEQYMFDYGTEVQITRIADEFNNNSD